jgi:UDP-2,3-diacylglucosamine hydrolase
MNRVILNGNKKIYFVSDAHLGHPPREKSLDREKLLVKWLGEIQEDAHSIYMLGDIFDYWFEYRKVVPRGFTRLLGKLSELHDKGIPVHFFTGNHDVWVFDYLPRETGVIVHREPVSLDINGKKFFMAHGDGLGPGDPGYKILYWIFHNKVLQWLYARIHPNATISFAQNWSEHSRLSKDSSMKFLGEEKEQLVLFSLQKLKQEYFDYFIFGHRHFPFDHVIDGKSHVICLGDWFVNFTYGEFDGSEFILKKYLRNEGQAAVGRGQ